MGERGKFRAAPWPLGLYGLAGATFLMGVQMSAVGMSRAILPLPGAVLGVLLVLAAVWACRATDALATALLGTGGALLLGYIVLTMLTAPDGREGPVDQSLGLLFFVLAAITWTTVVPAVARSEALAVVCVFLASSSTVATVACVASNPSLTLAAGCLFEMAAGCASYTASAILLDRAFGRTILPLDWAGRR